MISYDIYGYSPSQVGFLWGEDNFGLLTIKRLNMDGESVEDMYLRWGKRRPSSIGLPIEYEGYYFVELLGKNPYRGEDEPKDLEPPEEGHNEFKDIYEYFSDEPSHKEKKGLSRWRRTIGWIAFDPKSGDLRGEGDKKGNAKELERFLAGVTGAMKSAIHEKWKRESDERAFDQKVRNVKEQQKLDEESDRELKKIDEEDSKLAQEENPSA